MTETFISLIQQYGYLALFSFVFLQEVGAPNPVPNEIVLIASGYLIHSGYLSFFGVLSAIILADVSAAFILYMLFYFFGSWLTNSKPKWVPISTQTIMKLQQKVKAQGSSFVFLGRLAPFIRGYVAVVSGLSHINIKKYITIILLTTTIWGLFYLSIGYALSPYWQLVEPYFSKSTYVLVAVFLLIILIWLVKKAQFNFFLKS